MQGILGRSISESFGIDSHTKSKEMPRSQKRHTKSRNAAQKQRSPKDSESSRFIHNGFAHKKSLGQNFLHDDVILDTIVQSIPPHIATRIDTELQLIEVGIGLGDLTKRLLNRYSLLAYEIDTTLIAKARQHFKEALQIQRLQLIEADALKVRHENGYLFDSDYFLVSNLPYYIATAIIVQALKDPKCKGFLVMTQKEVAQKFCAKTAESSYCALSVLAQSFGEMSYLFEVPKEAFTPAPKVQSAVFRFERTERVFSESLEALLHFAFLAPRKKLLSNLAQWERLQDKAKLADIFHTLGLAQDVRAHEVSLQEYCAMLQYI